MKKQFESQVLVQLLLEVLLVQPQLLILVVLLAEIYQAKPIMVVSLVVIHLLKEN